MEITQSIFISFYLFIVGIYLVSIKKKSSSSSNYMVVLILLIPLFFGLRSYTVGTDSWAYRDYFNNQWTFMEPFITVLSKYIYSLNYNYQVFFLVISVLYFFSLKLAYKIIIHDYLLSNTALLMHYLLPYVIQMNINIVRQGLSFSFLLLSFALFFKYKNNKDITNTKQNIINITLSILLGFLSFFTHNSSIALLLAPLALTLLKRNSIKKLPYLLSIVSVISYSDIIDYILMFLSKVFNSSVFERLLVYSDTNIYKLLPKQLVYFLIITVFIHLLKDRYTTLADLYKDKPYHALSIAVLLLSFMLSFSYHASHRTLLFLDFIIPILLIDYIYDFSNKKQYFFLLISFCSLLIVIIFIVIYTNFYSLV